MVTFCTQRVSQWITINRL